MVDFLPLPPWQQVTSCSSKPSSVHSEVSVLKQWGTITGKGSRRRGRRHFSARFRPPNTDLYLSSDPLCSQQTQKNSSGSSVFGLFITHHPSCCFHRKFNQDHNDSKALKQVLWVRLNMTIKMLVMLELINLVHSMQMFCCFDRKNKNLTIALTFLQNALLNAT